MTFASTRDAAGIPNEKSAKQLRIASLINDVRVLRCKGSTQVLCTQVTLQIFFLYHNLQYQRCRTWI